MHLQTKFAGNVQEINSYHELENYNLSIMSKFPRDKWVKTVLAVVPWDFCDTETTGVTIILLTGGRSKTWHTTAANDLYSK